MLFGDIVIKKYTRELSAVRKMIKSIEKNSAVEHRGESEGVKRRLCYVLHVLLDKVFRLLGRSSDRMNLPCPRLNQRRGSF